MRLVLKISGLIFLGLSIGYRIYMFSAFEYAWTIQNILTFGLNHILGVLVAIGIAIVLFSEHKPSILILLILSSAVGIFQNIIDILQNLYLNEPLSSTELWMIVTPFAFHVLTLLGLLMVYYKTGKVLIVLMQSILIGYYGYSLFAVHYVSPFETQPMQNFFMLYASTHIFYGLLVITIVLYYFHRNTVDVLTR